MDKFIRKSKIGTVPAVYESFDRRIKVELYFGGKYEIFYRIPESETFVSIFQSRYYNRTMLFKQFEYGYNVTKKLFTLAIGNNVIIVGKMKDDYSSPSIITMVDITKADRIYGNTYTKCIRAYRDTKGDIIKGDVFDFYIDALGNLTGNAVML